MKRFHHVLRVTGNGSGIVNETIFPPPAGGAVYAWLVREEAGGGATALAPVLADGLRQRDTHELPPAENRVADEDAVTLTPSSTAASFRTAFTNAMPFHGGLRFVANVTATGSYALILSVWGERDDGSDM